jgi:DNA-binding NarL/FixJ family response regulator
MRPPGAVSIRSRRTRPQLAADVPDRVGVAVCDDQEIYRVGLRTVIDTHPDLTVVAEVDNIQGVYSLIDSVACKVVVVRQRLLDGLDDDSLRTLCRSTVPVLILAETESEIELVRALRAGASGYLPRGLAVSRLLDGIRTLAKGQPALDPAVARHLLRYMKDGVREPAKTVLDQLTHRQRDVALLVADGLTNEEIAIRLRVSQPTVKCHITAILQRLNIRNRINLVILINHDRVRRA